ncbi:MAG: NAD-dependent DNA ligase LigA, partial [Alistipes sp.]|nr:NAD-dependent DNA ligase LigA [Alistipes sp.]
EGEAKHYCPNQSHCRPQILGRIIHFVSRKAMNIEGLGEETIELLFENGLIENLSDLYNIKAEQLAILPRLGEKSARNIMQSLKLSLEVPFHRVLFALGIRFVGETTAKYIASHFKDMDAVIRATKEELTEAEEVGDKIADSIIDYLTDEQNLTIIERLREAGLQFKAEQKEQVSNSLEGLNFVISGSFIEHSRDELKALIEAHGGKNLAAVSANTSYLLAGDKIGPAKLQKATKLGVKIISEQEFIEMIGGGQATATPSEQSPKTVSQPKESTKEVITQGSLF